MKVRKRGLGWVADKMRPGAGHLVQGSGAVAYILA